MVIYAKLFFLWYYRLLCPRTYVWKNCVFPLKMVSFIRENLVSRRRSAAQKYYLFITSDRNSLR